MRGAQVDDLREQLARRLWEVDAKNNPLNSGYDWDLVGLRERSTFSHMADEVIRQIKWTWMSAKWANPENMSWDTEVLEDGEPNLTLAPKDWTP